MTPSKKDTMIKKIRNKSKTISNGIEKLELSRKIKINEIKNETKKKLNMLDDEISNILEKLDVNLITLELRCKFSEKTYDFKKERQLRLSAEEKINEIERLKEDAENNRDKLVDYLLYGKVIFLNY